MPDDMDAARTHELTGAMMRLVRDHLAAQPHGQFRVFEALNALAIATATISCGADVARCTSFFNDALKGQIDLIEAAKADGTFGHAH